MNFLHKLFFTRLLDFEVLYLTTKDFFNGLNPYINKEIFTGLGYPPNTLLFYFPFIFFNQEISQQIFSVLNLFFLVFCVFISLKIVKKSPKIWEVTTFTILLFLTFPARHTLLLGQNNFFAYAPLLLSFYFFQNKKQILSGIFLGLAISFKTIFIFLLLFYFLKKEIRILFYTSLTILIFVFITYLFFDPNLYLYWFNNVLPPLFRFSNREIISNQGISGFVSRLFSDMQTKKIITNVISGSLVIFTSLKTIKIKNSLASFSLFMITLNLVDSLAWQHHFVWLTLPFVYLAQQTKNIKYWVLLLISYILTATGQNFYGTIILYYLFMIKSGCK